MNEKIMVISNDGTKDIFKPRLIGQFIKEKTGVNDEIVKKIQNRIVSKIRNLNVPEITTTQIMAEVTAQLTKEGIKEEPYIIIKESDIMSLLTSYDNNNANQVFSAGALEYSLFEMAAKRYMSTQYSDEFREAKDYGLIYNHDSAQELFKGINCFTIDPRFIFKKGLSTYGDNNLGVISSPPKHLGTAINLVEEAIGLASTYIAGGVSIPSMGVFFAPFSKGLSDAETKQAFQEFFYRVNQSHKNRGSQSMFSSIQLDLEMPEFLKEQDAIGPGGEICGKYKDYEEENKRLCHIITQISLEGDALGKPIFFPNLIYNIDNADLSEWRDVFELSARFSIPYFLSPSNNNVEYQTTLGCRSALPSNWTGDPNIDCMGTGNSVYTTLCLPAVALKSKEEGRDFYEVLDENMQLIHDYNLERLDWIHKLWYEYNVADFMIQKDKDGNQLYDLENATIVMGYLGLSEALEILGYGPIEDCNDKAIELMKYMKQTIDKWKKEDNKRWGLFQTPAENATYKLAQKMVKRFGFKESYAKGTSERPYYTNSNHIPYDDDVDLIKRIKIEGDNQPLGPAGNIMNIYTSEAYSEPTALAKFCERIKNNTGAYFCAFTGDYSICNHCGTMFRGVVDTCTFDGSPTTQYSRVCGYITAVQAWNPGKKEEFIKRHRY